MNCCINLFIFFNTGRKYSTLIAKERNELIESRTKNVIPELTLIKDWLISIEEPFWNEFRVFEDLDLSSTNKDSQNKIKKQSLKIIVMIKKFMENLIAKTTKLSDISEKQDELRDLIYIGVHQSMAYVFTPYLYLKSEIKIFAQIYKTLSFIL